MGIIPLLNFKIPQRLIITDNNMSSNGKLLKTSAPRLRISKGVLLKPKPKPASVSKGRRLIPSRKSGFTNLAVSRGITDNSLAFASRDSGDSEAKVPVPKGMCFKLSKKRTRTPRGKRGVQKIL